jgi:hypothetical protein
MCLASFAQAAPRDHAIIAVYEGNLDYWVADYDAAYIHYTEAIAHDATYAMAWNNRGLAWFHRGNFADAESDFDHALTLDLSYAAAYLNKGKCLAAQKKVTEAITTLDLGLARSPGHPKILYNLGWVYDEMGEYDQAIARYNSALSADPAYHRARIGRAIALARKGLQGDAVHDFYTVINACETGDMFAALAAYNLQLLRGSGIDFINDVAAQDFETGVYCMGADLYEYALVNFQNARAAESGIPDIPWLMAWSHLMGRNNVALADARVLEAYGRMPSLTVQSPYESRIFIDGIYRGDTPALVKVFASPFDLCLRHESGSRGNVGGKNIFVYGDTSRQTNTLKLAFLNDLQAVGYHVTCSLDFPANPSLYDVIIITDYTYGETGQPISTALLDTFVSIGGGLIVFEWAVKNGAVSTAAASNPVASYTGLSQRTNTSIVDSASPLTRRLTAISSLTGWTFSPALKSGAKVAIQWSDGAPMAATYEYGAGRVVFFNDSWAWLGDRSDESWTGDHSYGVQLMRNAVDHVAYSVKREHTIIVYADETPGGQSPILVYPDLCSEYSDFAAVMDNDRDWLGDQWEIENFSGLSHGPSERNLPGNRTNLQRYWNWEPEATNALHWQLFE